MFDYKNFNWREATSNDSGQSSAALFICFWFGLSLILLTLIVGVLMVINAFHKIEVDFTPVLTFIGLQMTAVLTYLFGRLNSNNKVKVANNESNKEL